MLPYSPSDARSTFLSYVPLASSNDGRQWNNEDRERERGGKRETEKKIGLPFRERVLGLQAISRTLFCPIPPPPNAPLFSLPSILLPSFTLAVASSSLSFPLYRHRRGGPALIYLHPRARRRRRGVFIFCPASARCKVYRRDLHRFAFCFPSCSVVVVFVYARSVLYTNKSPRDPCLRESFCASCRYNCTIKD